MIESAPLLAFLRIIFLSVGAVLAAMWVHYLWGQTKAPNHVATFVGGTSEIGPLSQPESPELLRAKAELEKQKRLKDKQDLRREELRVQASTSKASGVYLTAWEVIHYLADESQWGVDKSAEVTPEGMHKNVQLEAPLEFQKRASEGRVTVYGASSKTGHHESIPKTYWMSHGLKLATIYDSEATSKTEPATFEAGFHAVRNGVLTYSDLKIEASDVYQTWPRRNDEAEFDAAFEWAALSREEAIKVLWKLRKDGVAIRNEPVPSEQLFPPWKAKYEKWRNDVLLAAEKVDENLRPRLEVLDQLRPPPTLPVINQDHALCITIVSEILLRLSEKLP